MRITDLSVTMFEWRGLPAASYSDKNPAAQATPELGLVSIETDAGITGHSFLGASFRSARLDVLSLTGHLKSAVMGQDPLEHERLWQVLSRRIRATTYRCIGAIDVALWDIAGKVASAVGKLICNSLVRAKVALTTKKMIITNKTSMSGTRFISSSSLRRPR